MPELKNLFIKGKMNKDLDERLVPQGEYRDALNVSVSYSEGSDVGALQNILGNTVRTQMLVSENPEVYVSVTPPADATCIGTVRDTENDKIYWFGTSATSDYIAELDPSTNVVDLILCDGKNPSPILNFSTSNLITGIAVLDGVLYFTDNLNEPRQVDIEHWRGVTGTSFTTTSTNLSADRISLYKKGPINAPTFHTLDSSIRGGNGTEGNNEVTISEDFSIVDIGESFTALCNIIPNYQIGDVVEMKNTFQNEFGEEYESIVRAELTSVGSFITGTVLSKTTEIENSLSTYTVLLEEDDPLFELKFPKFSYRYKYNNGQFSTMAPFSLPAFIPGDYEYTAKEGFNTGMTNRVRKLKLEGWLTTPAANNYQADIEEIEILYKDSTSPNVYIVEKLRKTAGDFPTSFEIKDEQIYKATQSNQLLRPFDSIPKKAKALEITGNRLIFGNYLQNFNVVTNPTFSISTISRTDTSQKFSLKSERTYQFGVVYQDEYGRQTPVFTDTTGVVKINSSKSDLNSAFEVSVTHSIPSELTHYKYYIKEVSNPYYNVAASNLYEEKETGHLYLSFPSSEVNKISENNILVLKKGSGNSPYKIKNNKFKVLSKTSNPPDFLKYKEEVVYATDYLRFDIAFDEGNYQTTRHPGRTPCAGHNTILLDMAGKYIEDNSPSHVTEEFQSNITLGSQIRFRRIGSDLKSKLYTVKSIEVGESGNDELEIVFEEPFGKDVEVIYLDNTADSEYSASIEKVEKKDDAGNPEYDGKFFIKINAQSQLKQALFEALDESSLKTLATHSHIHRQEEFEGHDIREYFVPYIASANSTLGNITSISSNTVNIPSGYHIVFGTENSWGAELDNYATDAFNIGLQAGNYLRFSGWSEINAYFQDISEYPNYKIQEVQEGFFGNQKYWAVKFTTNFTNSDYIPTSPSIGDFIVDVRSFSISASASPTNPPVFEIEPEEGVLDIYYETEKTYPISNLSTLTELEYTNCISFNNGVESDRIRDDFNAPTIGKGVRVSTTFEDNYGEERIKSGLIFSGLYNGKNGINRLNQFIIAENITEEANPIYGSIQKLNTRDTDLTLLCDDKILRVPARKDLLFQADGSPQLTSTDRFLGTIIPYAGNYGCQHPESFADHIYRAYFVDRTRGKVLRLGGDGITEISNYGMKDYFKDKLVAETGYMFGSYDENKDKYNISLPVENTVVSFSEGVNGWPTRMSFYEMESGISLNNMYYTFKDGKIFSHDNETRNTFYDTKIDSEVTFYLNGNPGSVKNFRTLNYQGDGSWVFSNITTNKQTGNVSSLVEKEGIYYGYISGESQTRKDSLDLKALNAQGLGTPESINGNTFTLNEVNSALQVGDRAYHSGLGDSSFGNAITAISGNTITLDGTAENNYYYFIKNNRFNTSGLLGYYAEITMTNTSTEKKELYSVGSEVSLSS